MRRVGILVVAGVLGATPGRAVGQAADPGPLLPIQREAAPGFTVDVDPRIELMAVLQLLSGYPVLTSHETPYRADVQAYFADHVEHPAVLRFDSLSAQGFSFDAVPKAFMWFAPLPELTLAPEVPNEVAMRAGGRAALADFGRLARDFATNSHFAEFFRAHAGTYDAMVTAVVPHAAAALEQLRGYTGMALPEVRLVVSALLHDGGFAMRGGSPPAQAFIGPRGVSAAGFGDFGDESRLGPLVWHEFAHTLVNPLTREQAALVEALEDTEEAFRAAMRRQAYEEWETIVNESIIRALEVRLATLHLGEEEGARTRTRQVERGFRHVPALAEALLEYERDRERYPTLADFHGRLLDVFRTRKPASPGVASLKR